MWWWIRHIYYGFRCRGLVAELKRLDNERRPTGLTLFQLWEMYVQDTNDEDERKQRYAEYMDDDYRGMFTWIKERRGLGD